MELLGATVSKLRKTEKARLQEIDELANKIAEYGRMTQHQYHHQKIFVNVKEVGRHFRQERRTVVEALELLRTQRRAEDIDGGENWTLRN
jgi:hypothetical protein